MTIAFSCPSCGTTFKVTDDWAGKKGPCKSCRNIFVVPMPAGSSLPPPPENQGAAPPETSASSADEKTDIADALRRVKVPAILMLVFAISYVLLAVVGVGSSIFQFSVVAKTADSLPPTVQEGAGNFMFEMPNPKRIEANDVARAHLIVMVFSFAICIIALILNSLVFVGAIKMIKLESRGLALTASIIVMIEGILMPLALCFGLPIGIWTLLVLTSADVKSHFR